MHAGENKYQIVQRGDYNMNEEYRISTHIITHEGQSPDYNDQETITNSINSTKPAVLLKPSSIKQIAKNEPT